MADLTAEEHCLLAEIEGVLRRARQATDYRHAFQILAVRIEDIAARYRELADAPPGDEEGALLDYLQGI